MPDAQGTTRRRIRVSRELVIFAALYVVYTAARWVVHSRLHAALSNAGWVISLERHAGVEVEPSVERALELEPIRWILANVYLAAQLVVPVIALAWTYRRARPVYVALRNTIIAVWLIAIPVFAAFPVAPPRMVGIGLGEAAGRGGAIALDGHSTIFYNPYAAVPSLHCGVAIAIAVALATAVQRRWARALALLWAPLVVLAVIATGNHYVFDVVTGLGSAAAGYALGRVADHLLGRVGMRPAAPVIVAANAVRLPAPEVAGPGLVAVQARRRAGSRPPSRRPPVPARRAGRRSASGRSRSRSGRAPTASSAAGSRRRRPTSPPARAHQRRLSCRDPDAR